MSRTLALRCALTTVAITLLMPAAAFAQEAGTVDPKPAPFLSLPTDQLWAYLAASIVPFVAYVINYHAPWLTDGPKRLVLAVAGAVAAGVTQAITAGNVGFNQSTLQFVFTGVVAAILAHRFVWSGTNIAFKAGADRNKQDAGE